MSIKAVIFDLDGTITQPFFDFDVMREQMGLERNAGPVWEAMAKMPAEQRRHAEKILNFHEQKAVVESRLNNGAQETVLKLVELGIKIGILTRNTKNNALAVLQKHNLKADFVIGREEAPVKPNPAGVLHICDYFGVKPSETLLVGDYLFDILCAKSAGAIAVLLANHQQADKFAEKADFTIDNLEQLIQIIENNGEKIKEY